MHAWSRYQAVKSEERWWVGFMITGYESQPFIDVS